MPVSVVEIVLVVPHNLDGQAGILHGLNILGQHVTGDGDPVLRLHQVDERQVGEQAVNIRMYHDDLVDVEYSVMDIASRRVRAGSGALLSPLSFFTRFAVFHDDKCSIRQQQNELVHHSTFNNI